MPQSNVRRINGIEITGTPAIDDVAVADSTTSAVWAAPGGTVLTGAVILAPTTSSRNTVQDPGSGDITLLTLKSAAFSGVQPLLEFVTNTGTTRGGIYCSGERGAWMILNSISSFAPSYTMALTQANGTAVMNLTGTSGADGIICSARRAGNLRGTSTSVSALRVAQGSSSDIAEFAGANTTYINNDANFTGFAAGLYNATGNVSVAASAAPSVDDVIVATSSTVAEWGPIPIGNIYQYALLHKSSDGKAEFYATLTDAKDNASSGDNIEVFAGTYDEKDLFKNGVNWFFHAGAEVVYTGSSNGGIWDDSSTGSNGAVTCTIGGYGRFSRQGTGSSDFTINVTNSSSDVQIHCAEISNTTSNSNIRHSGSGSTLIVETAYLYQSTLTANTIDVAGSVLKSTINAEVIQGGKMLCSATGGESRIRFNQAYDINSIACSAAAEQWVEGNSLALTGSNGAIQTSHASALQYVDINFITHLGSDSGIICTSGTQYVSGQKIEYTGGVASTGNVRCIAGEQNIMIDIITSDATTQAVTGTGGTQRIHANVIECTGTGGEAIEIDGQTLELYGSPQVNSEASATDAITASGAQNAAFYGSPTLNKALNSNITVTTGSYYDSNGVFIFTHAVNYPIETVTAASDTLDATNKTVLCDCTSNAITINLPAAADWTGVEYSIKKIDSTSNTVTVDGSGSETIDGATTQDIIFQYDAMRITSDGTQWWIL